MTLGLVSFATPLSLAQTHAHQTPASSNYEMWAIDQGTHIVHIFNSALEEIETIDLGALGIRVPHMVEFTSDDRYAFVASPGSGDVAVIRTDDRKVLAVIPTGPRTHHAAVAPDDRSALVSVIGAANAEWDGKLVEILFDPSTEEVTMGRQLILADDPMFAARQQEFRETGGAVCLAFTSDGRYGYVTLGPELDEGGVVVMDMDSFELVKVYSPGEIEANCGTVLSPTGEHMYLVGGSGDAGIWYAADTKTHEPVHRGESHGHDAHGSAITPDGREYWMVNRVTSNAIIVDTQTLEVIDEVEFTGKTPDIVAISPDNRYAFITLRGPNPVTMPHVAVGETPGIAVFDVATREMVKLIEPAKGNDASDFHAVAVRRLGR